MSFAGVSVVGEVWPPQPASATTAVTYSGYHLLVVNGYSSLVKDISNGECIESRHFKVGGYRWTLRCYPNGCVPDQDGYTSFYLFLDQGNVVDPVIVQYEFSFVVDQVLHHPPLLDGAKETLKFCSRDPYSSSAPCLTERKHFEKSKCLKNDSFTIRCDVIITKDVNINEAGGTVPVSKVLPPSPDADIRQDLGDLLRSGTGADVTFQVWGGTFRAHRCVLAARSAVFKAQLFGPMKEGATTDVVHVRDMEEQVFKLLLGFIYTDSVPEVDDDDNDTEEDGIMWQHLLEASDRYDLPRLTLMCEQKLCAYINTTTVATILEVAAQHHRRGLKEACLDFLASPGILQRVMALDALEPLVISCPSVLKDLLEKLASLKINTGNTSAATQPPVIDVPQSDMHLHFSSLLQSEERTDVTFLVGGETLRAHRCLLAARSAVFRAELFGFGPMKDTASDVIRIDDMEARVFKLLLTFIYSDTAPVSRMKRELGERNEDDADVMWQQLLVAADRYGIQRLKQLCERSLGRYINTNTVAAILALAEQHHCRRLKEECLNFLDFPAHLKQVMAIGGLDHLRSICPSVLIDLIAKLAAL